MGSYYHHFTDKETETWWRKVTCPRSQQVVLLGLEQRHSGPKVPHTLILHYPPFPGNCRSTNYNIVVYNQSCTVSRYIIHLYTSFFGWALGEVLNLGLETMFCNTFNLYTLESHSARQAYWLLVTLKMKTSWKTSVSYNWGGIYSLYYHHRYHLCA